MSTTSAAPVVVGVDGSESSLEAVRFAASEAALRRRPLRVVHAFIWPMMPAAAPLGTIPPDVEAMRHHAEGLLAEATEQARKAAPEVHVSSKVVTGAAVPVLLHESRTAELLVLGDRGLGGLSGLLLGSVAVQTVTHAACPVLVVRGQVRADGPVVVGVDGSDVSTSALRAAAAAAELRGCDLVTLHAFTDPVSSGPGDMVPLVYDPDVLETEERLLLAEAVAAVAGDHPDVRITQEVVNGPARQHLIEWSRRAQLLVVGARGRGGFTGLLLGSVSQHLMYHSACPTLVVRMAAAQEQHSEAS
ncbi:universal stress protein [Krasilnikovia sp. M28-CT-15]|uniref:universal stress protein n=1 Tax=Krasilnikovia sp. M28-CT-15 TaxID=3373540 RepID=UPI003875D896